MRRRVWTAFAIAPLAGPVVICGGLLLRGALTHQIADAPDSMAEALKLLYWLVVFGAPLGYGATLFVGVPAFRFLDAGRRLSWWSLTLVGSIGGGALFPLYLRLMEPRGAFHFFPGAGFLAGAASALSFWLIAAR